MSADEDNFYLTHDLYAELNDQEFFAKKWEETVKRELA